MCAVTGKTCDWDLCQTLDRARNHGMFGDGERINLPFILGRRE